MPSQPLRLYQGDYAISKCIFLRTLLIHLLKSNLQDKSLIIVIMEICNAPTPRLKALNQHDITHIMCIEIENVIRNLTNR